MNKILKIVGLYVFIFCLFMDLLGSTRFLSFLNDSNFLKRLNLTEIQLKKVEEIKKIEKKQKYLDEKTFSYNFKLLKSAKKVRTNMIEEMFLDILNKNQKKEYFQLKKNRIIGYGPLSFVKLMEFTNNQKNEIDVFVKIYKSDEKYARENFGNNANKLIVEASERLIKLDYSLNSVLNKKQKVIYEEIKFKRDKDVEFFRLKEGLILSKEQAYEIKMVLDENRELRKELVNLKDSDKRTKKFIKKDKNMFNEIKYLLKPFQVKLLNQLFNIKDNKRKSHKGMKSGMNRGRSRH